MTAKEKADELWWKYYNSIEHKLSEEYSPHEKHITKELVLIALNEIIRLDILGWYRDWETDRKSTRLNSSH